MITAIDWAIAENERPGSAYYGRLDPHEVAVMGQSCGGLQATAVAGDPRIKTVVIRITSYNVCYTKLLRKARERLGFRS